MAFSPDDDSVLASDGAGSLTVASIQSSVRAVAADTAAISLLVSDRFVSFSTTGAGSHTISNSTMAEGQTITLFMTAQSTGTYTMAVDEGTLTFNAADECATIFYDGTAVRVLALQGATIV